MQLMVGLWGSRLKQAAKSGQAEAHAHPYQPASHYDDDGLWWLFMVYDDFRSFMMICDNQWCSMMIYGNLWWSMKICNYLWWFMMIYDDLWWSMMIYDDLW